VPTKPIIATILAACSVAASPDNIEPPVLEEGEDQHFCCSWVDMDSKTGEGEGCVAIAKESINSCNGVLYCDGKWQKLDGKVKCI
jgi:hypothetical protein